MEVFGSGYYLNMRNYILCFVGPSGSGKTTLTANLHKHLPQTTTFLISTSSREKRNADDDFTYRLVSREEYQELLNNNAFATHTEYANNYYGFAKQDIESALSRGHALCAVQEGVVLELQKLGYPIKVIRILPTQTIDRGNQRLLADAQRSKITIPVDVEVINSFDPGGLQKATLKLVAFVKSLN